MPAAGSDRGFSAQRLASLRSAFPDGDTPPIEVYEVGGAFFVSDGHHRVALARQTHRRTTP